MNAEEVMLIRDIRRWFDRVPIDSSRMEVSLQRGHVTLTGTVKSLRSNPLINVKETFEDVERKLRRDQRIKQLNIECRIMQAEKKEVQHFNTDHFIKTDEEQTEQAPGQEPVAPAQ